MKKSMLFAGALALAFACGPAEKEGSEILEEVEETVEDVRSSITPEWVVYQGSIPCLDCDYISMELWLEHDETEVTPDYRLVMEYKNTPAGDTEEEVEGNYTIIAGHGQDRDATLYQLNPGTNEPRYFVLNDDNTITMLGENMQPLDEEVDNDYNYTLQLKEAEE